jgi:hypothetical protein
MAGAAAVSTTAPVDAATASAASFALRDMGLLYCGWACDDARWGGTAVRRRGSTRLSRAGVTNWGLRELGDVGWAAMVTDLMVLASASALKRRPVERKRHHQSGQQPSASLVGRIVSDSGWSSGKTGCPVRALGGLLLG